MQSESAVQSRAVWVDGYGRSHYVAATGQEVANDGAAVQSVAAVERRRQDPWHGYDSDCDQKK